MADGKQVTKEYMDNLTAMVVDEIYQTYFMYGPGLFERVYEATLAGRIEAYNVKVERQKQIFIKNIFVKEEPAFFADLVIDEKIIIELKSVEKLSKLHHKQLSTYLKLTGMQVGYLVNFNCAFLKDNIKRIVHNHPY